MKIYINPGHGLPHNRGAEHNGRIERDDNAKYANAVADILKNAGHTVKVEREDTVRTKLSHITQSANSWGADLFISFHRNADGGTGAECLVSSKSKPGSRQLAEAIQAGLVSVGFKNRGVKIQDERTFVLQNVNMPSVTIEAGFIDSPGGVDNNLFDSKFHTMVIAIAEAILKVAGGTLPDNIEISDPTESALIGNDVALSGPNDIASLAAIFGDVDPYIILPDKNLILDNVDPVKLRDAQISGIMLYGGQIYSNLNPNAAVNIPSISPHLGLQTEFCEKNHFYYGLLFNSMICTEEQLNKEIKEVIKVIQLYSPALGVWLNIDWDKGSKDKNNQYLLKFQKYLIKYGLKDKIGLYVTREQLAVIDWSQFQNDWYLWLIDHVEADTNLEDFAFSWDFFYLDPDKSEEVSQTPTSATSKLANEAINVAMDSLDTPSSASNRSNNQNTTTPKSSNTNNKTSSKAIAPASGSGTQKLANTVANVPASQTYSNDHTSTRRNLLNTLRTIYQENIYESIITRVLGTEERRMQIVDKLVDRYGYGRLQLIASDKYKLGSYLYRVVMDK